MPPYSDLLGARSQYSPRMQRAVQGLVVSLLLLATPAVGSAEPAPIGSPPHAVDLSLVTRRTQLSLRAGNTSIPIALNPEGATLALEGISLSGGVGVIVARINSHDQIVSVILVEKRGAIRALLNERSDLHGDPGERHGIRIETRDRTGDGVADIVVGEVRENIRLCGQPAAMLFARAVNPSTLTLDPVSLLPFDEPPNATSVVASTTSPGPTGSPRVPTLRMSAASSIAGVAENPEALSAPRALEAPNGRGWSEGRGGTGRGEFVAADWLARGLAVHALALTYHAPDPASASSEVRPTSVWIVGSSGTPIRVTLPDAAPGERIWIPLPQPAHWSCVSVVLDTADQVDTNHSAAARVTLGSVEAYSEVDFGARLEQFVAALDEPGVPGENALFAVRAFGHSALPVVVRSFANLAEIGKMRALEILASTFESNDEARALAVESVRGSSNALSEAALQQLRQAGPRSRASLAPILMLGNDLADRVALALAESADEDFMRTLLTAIGATGGTERPALRRAAWIAATRNVEARGVLANFATSTPNASVAAALAAEFREENASAVDVAHLLVDLSYARVESFPDRYRITKAAMLVGRDPGLVEWLVRQALHAEEWMQRDAALLALRSRHTEELSTTAAALLQDAYPRVRVRAISVLAVDDTNASELTRLSREDTWPMVRATALGALALVHRGEPQARQALRDVQHTVRAAAIRALADLDARDAWPEIAAMLLSDSEWPDVIEAGLVFARTECVSDATDALVSVMRRGLRPNAWAPDQDLTGLALNVGATLGGTAAEETLRIAARETSPAALRGEAARLVAHPPERCSQP